MPKAKARVYTIQIPIEIANQVDGIAKETRTSKSDVLRLAIQIGIKEAGDRLHKSFKLLKEG
ncbi:MAG: hypothetical protein OXH34_01695 [Bacteroidetes bacterium]|nr:hypothetical protein [Bacteroidota bacterium]